MAEEAIVNIQNLKFGYDHGDVVVWIKDLLIQRGAIVSVLGPSGCGKTTFLSLLGGLVPLSGNSYIRLAGLKVEEAVKRGLVSISFQTPVLMPWLTAIGNVSLPLKLKALNFQSEDMEEALNKVHLGGAVQSSYPKALSSGMRSRIAVAQAMVTRASILLMDEVFGTLDEATRIKMNLMLRDINSTEMNATIIFVTHSIDEALLLSDRILVFKKPQGEGMSSIVLDLEIDISERSTQTRYSPKFLEFRAFLEKLVLEED
jgi:NitT/TauT family transport system ATP-binding protein